VNGRIDVTSLSHIDLQGIFRMGTDYPGSPNIQADLARLPIYTTYGGYAGFGQRFNLLEVTVKSGVEHTDFQQSVFVNGQTDSNADRDYTQYTTTLRSAYDLTPEFRPFAEVSTNKRVHDLSVDRFGVDRDSVGYSAKIGTSVDLVRTVTGEIAVGYLNQMYIAPLPNSGGFLIDGALTWNAQVLARARRLCGHAPHRQPLCRIGCPDLHVHARARAQRRVPPGMGPRQRSRLQLRGQRLAFGPAPAALAPGSVKTLFRGMLEARVPHLGRAPRRIVRVSMDGQSEGLWV
jgi:Putative beta-barrel porin 2